MAFKDYLSRNLRKVVQKQQTLLGALAAKDTVAMTDLASALQEVITGKADAATTLAGYGITDAMTATQIQAAIAAEIGSTYRPSGTIAGSELVAGLLVTTNFGNVYNISSDLAITAANESLFANLSAGDKVSAGDDVGVVIAPATYTAASGTAVEGVTYYELEGGVYVVVSVETGESVEGYYTKDADSYLFNDFAGFVDLSSYSTTSEMNTAIATAIASKITLTDLSVGTATGDGNVVTNIAYDNTTGEFTAVKGTTAVLASELVDLTDNEVDALFAPESGS